MIEVAKIYVRPKTHDRQRHVFLVLFDSSCNKFSSVVESFKVKLDSIFPFGYYINSKSCHVVDFFCDDDDVSHFSENYGINHSYLTKYLSSPSD